jgi:ATPase subunit of ABC transporter with duplicated ATPase domains
MSCAPIVALRDLSFSYDSAQEFLITHLSVHFPIGFTGVVGANGSGKSTLLQLISGSQAPGKSGFAGVVEGTIEGAGDAVCCEQCTDNPPHKLLQFLEDWDSDACELRGRLGIQLESRERENTRLDYQKIRNCEQQLLHRQTRQHPPAALTDQFTIGVATSVPL